MRILSFVAVLACSVVILPVSSIANRDLDPKHAIFACDTCHMKIPEPGQTARDYAFVGGSLDAMCRSCHPVDQEVPQQPVRESSRMALMAMSEVVDTVETKKTTMNLSCIRCHTLRSDNVIRGSRNIPIGMGLAQFEMCIKCHGGDKGGKYYTGTAEEIAPFSVVDKGYDPNWPQNGNMRIFIHEIKDLTQNSQIEIIYTLFTSGSAPFPTHPPSAYNHLSPGFHVEGSYERVGGEPGDPVVRGTFGPFLDQWSYQKETITWNFADLQLPPGLYRITLTPKYQYGPNGALSVGLPFTFEASIGEDAPLTVEVLKDINQNPKVWGQDTEIDIYNTQASPNEAAMIRYQFDKGFGDVVNVRISKISATQELSTVADITGTQLKPNIPNETQWDGRYAIGQQTNTKVPPGLYQASVSINGGLHQGSPEILVVGPDPEKSSVANCERPISSNGQDCSVIKVVLTDALGRPLPASDNWKVILEAESGNGIRFGEGAVSGAGGNEYYFNVSGANAGNYIITARAQRLSSELMPVGTSNVVVVRFVEIKTSDDEGRKAKEGKLQVVGANEISCIPSFDPENANMDKLNWYLKKDGVIKKSQSSMQFYCNVNPSFLPDYSFNKDITPEVWTVTAQDDIVPIQKSMIIEVYPDSEKIMTLNLDNWNKVADIINGISKVASAVGAPKVNIEPGGAIVFNDKWMEYPMGSPNENLAAYSWGLNGEIYVKGTADVIKFGGSIFEDLISLEAWLKIIGELKFFSDHTKFGVEVPVLKAGFGGTMAVEAGSGAGIEGMMYVKAQAESKLIAEATPHATPYPMALSLDTKLEFTPLTVLFRVSLLAVEFDYVKTVWQEPLVLTSGTFQILPW